MPYAPGDSPWDPSNSGQYYTGYGVANRVLHVTTEALSDPNCRLAITFGVGTGLVIVSEGAGSDGVGIAAAAQSNADLVTAAIDAIATEC